MIISSVPKLSKLCAGMLFAIAMYQTNSTLSRHSSVSTVFSSGHILSLNNALDLKEASQPPDLEERLANDNTDNKHVPPLDSAVCALGGVSVGALTDDDVLLLILDLGKEFGQFAD